MRYARSRPEPLPWTSLVVGLYGAMAIVAVLISAGRGDPDLYRLEARGAGWLLASPLLGLLGGVAVVALTQTLARRTRWGAEVARALADRVGALSPREVWVLAAASSIGEELLFRGALLPWWGWELSTLAFAALHVAPSRALLPWTLSALLCGAGLAGLVHLTGDLGAAIAAHFVINLLNLRYLGARVR